MNKKLIQISLLPFLLCACSQPSETSKPKEETFLNTTSDSIGYLCGYQAASFLLSHVASFPDTMTFKSQCLVKGFLYALTADSAILIDGGERERRLNGYHEILNKRKHRVYIAYGDSLIREYAKNDSTVTMDNGVRYKILKKGTGPTPSPQAKVLINYVGRDFEGKKFDQTPHSEARWIGVEEFNECLQKPILLMPEGSVFQVVVPPYLFNTLSFGENSRIKPYSALIYDFELKSIKE